jgi:hypothetical protein
VFQRVPAAFGFRGAAGRSGDWGSASPFSFGWWAVAGDDYLLDGQVKRTIPRVAIVRYREWYGSGDKLTADVVGREDHAADEWRYACMSRPWIKEKPQEEEKGERTWGIARSTWARALQIGRRTNRHFPH